ncbi:hypothetical protein [Homoserinibacter gongjuensis]|uniref:hypothetical protein n=1 Tax=Homoserinibacter gongjuensis TaxID=1162968 RepID=UPI0024E13553|nr:hypothetical protein [Homoserinibacter gongjuensis]
MASAPFQPYASARPAADTSTPPVTTPAAIDRGCCASTRERQAAAKITSRATAAKPTR